VSFVDDIFKVLKTKSYALSNLTRAQASGARLQSPRQQQPQASRAAPIPSIVGTSNSDYEPQAARSSNVPPLHAPKGPAATRAGSAQHRLPDRPTALSPAQSKSPGANTQHLSRKRKLVQRDTSETREGQDPHYNRVSTATRPTKQAARRSGKNLRGGAAAFEPHNSFPSFTSMPNMLSMANLPPPPPGPLPFDMSNPMAFFAMMAALGTTMPGMPTLPLITPQSTPTSGQARRGKCHDYHTKGFCARGTMCLFEHGNTSATPDEVPEYDPDQPSLSMRSTLAPSRRQGTKGLKGGRPRASFSLPGPAYDQNNTTLVVEQIPEDKFSEDHVRDFFSQFGPIVDLHMHAFKRLAIVKFEDHASADQAYNSPRAVFENRFVKVYWHRNNSVPGGAGTIDDDDVLNGDEEVLDLEEIERRQAEAQKAFEERRRRIEEADAKSAEIDRQLLEKDAEMKKIRQQLAELAGDETDGNKEEEFSQDLATLQAEAESLFAQNDHIPSSGRGRGYPPRGAFRGRRLAPFPPRGRGAHRGGYRGRGAFAAPFPSNRSSVKRLDNRPKRLAVTGIEKGSMKDEALRQYLVVSHRTYDLQHACTNRVCVEHARVYQH
jgi:hypothetical protein